MFQNPVSQQQLASELDREKAAIWRDRRALPQSESVLDSLVRRLRQMIGTKPMQPLTREPA
jgi:outer membrane protein TolC